MTTTRAASGPAADGGNLSGSIAIDGSSTVAPFAQAAQEAFQAENPDVKITVGTAGTGGGFEKFCAGETDISNASRPIKDDEEVPVCKKNGVVYDEVQVANDGIAVVTNTALKVDCLTTAQLKQLWNKGSKVKSLSEIDPKLPDTELELFGPGTDSGTFDFFTDQINGEEGVSRDDYQPSEDDNILVQGVEGSDGGLGYFGFSYYEQNQDKLNLVGVDGGDGCVKPSTEAIQDGSYTPLSRPLFMYPSEKALKRPEVKAFMDYVIANYDSIATTSQIVPMTDRSGRRGQEGARDGGVERRPDGSRQHHRSRRARRPHVGGGAPPLWRGRDQGHPDPRHLALDPHHHGDRDRAARADDRVLRRRRRLGVPLGQQVDAALRAAAATAFARWWWARSSPRASRCSWPPRSGSAPRSTSASTRARACERPSSPSSRSLAGVPTIVFGYFALTFFTPEILRGLLQRRREHLQRARGRHRHGLHDRAHGGLGRARTRCRRSRSRCARAPSGSAPRSSTSPLRVVFPAALSGIVAALVLGVSRAIGETMIVLIAAGQIASNSLDPRDPHYSLASFIGATAKGDIPTGSTEYKTIFAVGMLLFLLTLIMNLISIRFVRKYRQVYE